MDYFATYSEEKEHIGYPTFKTSLAQAILYLNSLKNYWNQVSLPPPMVSYIVLQDYGCIT